MSAVANRVRAYLIVSLLTAAALLIIFAVRTGRQTEMLAERSEVQRGADVADNPHNSDNMTPDISEDQSEPDNSAAHLGVVSENPLRGRTIFVSKGCINCHSVWGVGGKLGPDLSRAGMGRSFLQISGLLWSHSPRMIELMEQRGVARPTFTADEMGELVSYLYYLNYFNEPGDAIAGRTLFSEKGCISCHSVGVTGGNIASALDKYQEYASPLFLAQAMWNQGPRMAVSLRTQKMVDPVLQGKDIADIAAYVRGQAFGNTYGPKLMSPGNPITGQRLFAEKRCVSCHSIYATGGTLGPDLARKDLFQSATEIAGAMWNHGPLMWSKMQQTGITKPSFSGNELADLISYLYFVRYTDEAGNARNGKQLFDHKGCAECHTVGHGEKIGPDLGTSKAATSAMSLTAAMWNHAPVMEKLTEAKRLPWPKFGSDEMRDLVEFIKLSTADPTKRAEP